MAQAFLGQLLQAAQACLPGFIFSKTLFSPPHDACFEAAARAAAHPAGFYFYHVYAHFHAAYHSKAFFLSIFLFFSEKLLTFFLYVL